MATALRATRALFTALPKTSPSPKSTPTTTNPTTPPTILEVERKFRRLTVPTLTNLTNLTTTTFTTTPSNHPSNQQPQPFHGPHHQPFHSVLPLPTRTIHDTYYDAPHHALCAAGAWVRRRDGLWEAKLRRGGDRVNSRFEELRGREAVGGCVRELLGGQVLGGGKGDEDYVVVGSMKGDGVGGSKQEGDGVGVGRGECFGLVVMADLVTKREAWLVDGEFRVVRDVMDFGHEVGEVELQVEVGGAVGEEEKRVMMEAMDRRVEGFMERYAWAWESGEPVGKLTAYFEMLKRREG
ncbi:CYTH-like domain-containing protein [Chaetomium fimeti]|uniref:CYTH-like domain-containing protein n=1 Tax=Chaetomium fimeti TaxID=1854472 RepID=A0AAE0LNZ2_9PEZI|nr:CYTH-like domain-containing protein [Chaetomium fimeti]